MASKDLSYKHQGGPVGVLLLHGLCGTPAEMHYVASSLARNGHTVHCPQLAGHGGTGADIKASTWQDWYASAEAALLEMRKTCDTVIVGGLSTGAALSLLLAARHPDKVQATTLFAPTLWLNGWLLPWQLRLFNLVQSKWLASKVDFPDLEPHGIKDPRIRAFIEAAHFGGDGTQAQSPTPTGGAVIEHQWLVHELKKCVSKITQPTLILHPREDNYAGLSNVTYLQRNLGGLVDTVVLHDSYHMVTVDRQRHVVVERCLGFIERLVKARAPAGKARLTVAPLQQAA